MSTCERFSRTCWYARYYVPAHDAGGATKSRCSAMSRMRVRYHGATVVHMSRSTVLTGRSAHFVLVDIGVGAREAGMAGAFVGLETATVWACKELSLLAHLWDASPDSVGVCSHQEALNICSAVVSGLPHPPQNRNWGGRSREEKFNLTIGCMLRDTERV
ncbi:hypothetical protein K438DRAFT_1774097 [Mycena galopus ATCC 62051]|nr:hypothetical protein K438DRAFT_1774097 [Mycena galopus ATCC 62051]